MANDLALSNNFVRNFDPNEGPKNAKKLAVGLGVMTSIAAGFTIYHIATAVTLTVAATVASMGIALLVVAVVGVIFALISQWKGANDDREAGIELQNRVLQHLPENRGNGLDLEEGAVGGSRKPGFWRSNAPEFLGGMSAEDLEIANYQNGIA